MQHTYPQSLILRASTVSKTLVKRSYETDTDIQGAVAPKTASALWQGFMLCMESLPYFYEKSVEPMA